MKNNLNKIAVLLLLCLFQVSLAASQIVIAPTTAEELQSVEALFIKAFSKAYENLSPVQLGVADKEEFLKSAFSDVAIDFNDKQALLLTAKTDGQIVGFVEFKLEEPTTSVYVAQLAVDPDHWRSGIGSQLVRSLMDYWPQTSHITVIARRLNVMAKNFYEGLHFKESAYMHEGYDPVKYIGFEYEVPR